LKPAASSKLYRYLDGYNKRNKVKNSENDVNRFDAKKDVKLL